MYYLSTLLTTLTQGLKKFIIAFNNKITSGMQYEIVGTKIANMLPEKLMNLNICVTYHWLKSKY